MIYNFRFDKREILTFAHDTDCVYILCHNDTYQYIGQTKNLRQPITDSIPFIPLVLCVKTPPSTTENTIE